MKLGFYPKLAGTGMRSNRKLYLPYLITCISMVAMLYIVGYLSGAEAVRHLPGGQFIQESLGLGVWIIALFAGLFLVYVIMLIKLLNGWKIKFNYKMMYQHFNECFEYKYETERCGILTYIF